MKITPKSRHDRLRGHRFAVAYLISVAVLLPMGMVFLFVFGLFFSFCGDVQSAMVLDVLALILGFFWLLSLVALLLNVAFITLLPDRDIVFNHESLEKHEK